MNRLTEYVRRRSFFFSFLFPSFFSFLFLFGVVFDFAASFFLSFFSVVLFFCCLLQENRSCPREGHGTWVPP